jgi:hypothetical protein
MIGLEHNKRCMTETLYHRLNLIMKIYDENESYASWRDANGIRCGENESKNVS